MRRTTRTDTAVPILAFPALGIALACVRIVDHGRRTTTQIVGLITL